MSGHAIGQSRSGVQRVAHCVILNDAIDSAWVGVVYSGYIVHTHRAAQSMSQRVERLTMREINFFRVEKAVYALLVIGTWGRVNCIGLFSVGLVLLAVDLGSGCSIHKVLVVLLRKVYQVSTSWQFYFLY